MKRTAFDEGRDLAVANKAGKDAQAQKALMCRAIGCPNRWSVNTGDKVNLCSAHAWSDSRHWPRITQEQLDAEADRLRGVTRTHEPPRMSREQAVKKLASLRFAAAGRDWAHALRKREQQGERLSPAQASMWRTALGWIEPEAPPQLDGMDPAPVDNEYVPDLAEEDIPW